MKQTIRINESQLREMIAESVKRVLSEMSEGEAFYCVYLGEDGDVEVVEPLCRLSEENIREIEGDEPEIIFGGREIYVPSENYNTNEGIPQVGDYLFQCFGDYSIYRIGGEYGVTGGESPMGDMMIIGTKGDLLRWFKEYSSEAREFGMNVREIISRIKMI